MTANIRSSLMNCLLYAEAHLPLFNQHCLIEDIYLDPPQLPKLYSY